MSSRRLSLFGVLVTACTLAIVSAATASSNNQIVLSATGINTSVGPGGFWIWSQPGGNKYGNDGQGNMYFYALHIQKPVEASNVVLNGATVTEQVAVPLLPAESVTVTV